MFLQEALEEYNLALKQGQREYKARLAAGKDPYPKVLDEILPRTDTVIDMGIVEIPAEQIVGVKSTGRTNAFSAAMPMSFPSAKNAVLASGRTRTNAAAV